MALVLIAIFVIMPLAELFVIVTVAESIGVLETFLALLLFSVLGAMMVRREGLSVWRRANEQLNAGRVPTKELSDGVLILGGGALLLAPGFISDFFGLLMLLPPTRAVIRPLLSMLFVGRLGRAGRITVVGVRGAGAVAGRVRRNPGRPADADPGQSTESWAQVIDVEVNDPTAIDPPGPDTSRNESGDPGREGA